MNVPISKKCPICGGSFKEGTTTFTVDYDYGVLIARHVPALICELCGESWIDDAMSRRLQQLVDEAKEKKRQIEVIDMAA